MQEYEVNILLSSIPFTDKNSWEQCRYNIYSVAQMFSKKKLKPTDFMKFEWDKPEEILGDNTSHEISNEDIKRLTEISKSIKITD